LTPRAALARAVEVLRTEGVRALVSRAASETVYRRLALVERELENPLDVDVPSGLEFGYLDERELDEYERLRPGERDRAAARLAAGHRCFGTWAAGRLVAVRWLATGSPHVEYLDLFLPLPPDAIYHYDTFTDPLQRRRGISAATHGRLFSVLREEGFRCTVRAVLPENRAAVGDALRAGFRASGHIGYIRLGPWRRPFLRW
jgi:GNAT superfamily N-acetyltransferase